MPGLFSICIKGAIAVVGCAVLFCAVNGPGAAQHAAHYQQRTTTIVANVANPAQKGDRLPMTAAAKAHTPSFYAKSSCPGAPHLAVTQCSARSPIPRTGASMAAV